MRAGESCMELLKNSLAKTERAGELMSRADWKSAVAVLAGEWSGADGVGMAGR